ncbi:hypothetical protein XBO1_1820023 [Xenorhabdus bovienii str. oregonense]|uniref:Uncharacterized protein n=1 Tax=Xenorhabdus bovienii str. oregonense TaxID=1398202 RepID=A0A077NT41_XENBV|nr:hypothetical protein XBO1_1820023 [Xenorhabdus bovienii str. oregonense]
MMIALPEVDICGAGGNSAAEAAIQDKLPTAIIAANTSDLCFTKPPSDTTSKQALFTVYSKTKRFPETLAHYL